MFSPGALLRPLPCKACLQHVLRRSYASASKAGSSTSKPTPTSTLKPSVAATRVTSPPPKADTPQKIPPPTAATASGTGISMSSPPSMSNEPFRLRTYKPRTPGVRHLKRPINDHLWKGRPYGPLTIPKRGHGLGGRNRLGRITTRHRGGGHKRRIRTVDFSRFDTGQHVVERIEHDPNRSAHIALIRSTATDKRSYIVAAEGMRAGDTVESFRAGIPPAMIAAMGGSVDPGMLAAKTAFRGNCLPIKLVPTGTQVYNVGSTRGKGAVFCRSAGTYAVVISKEENRKGVKEVVVKLQSGEVRRVAPDACATIGVASNPHHHFRQLGKAGRSRWLGIRPRVRGVAMNAVDHPMGGGRGKGKGNNIPQSPWGTIAKSGYKTRKKRNINKNLVHDRPRNQGKRRSKVSS